MKEFKHSFEHIKTQGATLTRIRENMVQEWRSAGLNPMAIEALENYKN